MTAITLVLLDWPKVEMTDSDRAVYLLGVGLGGRFGGELPDVLEPALHPHHRQLCHGILPVGSVVALTGHAAARTIDRFLQLAAQSPRADQLPVGTLPLARWNYFFLAGVLKGFMPGYLSHVVLDSATSRSVPWIGRLQ